MEGKKEDSVKLPKGVIPLEHPVVALKDVMRREKRIRRVKMRDKKEEIEKTQESALEGYMTEFIQCLRLQLRFDEKRWGETWRHRPLEGQEERVISTYANYVDQFRHAATPMPWMKVVGNAFIAWVRENHPEALAGGAKKE